MRITMMGTGPFAVPLFRWLLQSDHQVLGLITRPPRPHRGKVVADNAMQEVAKAHCVSVSMPASVNDSEAHRALEKQGADLFVVCDYGQILSKQTLGLANLGGINLHGSLLPQYRGAAPVNWAIYHGDLKSGVSVIHMTYRLDGGPILVQDGTTIDPDETAVELETRLAELGVQSVETALNQLEGWDGKTEIGRRQDKTHVTQAPRLTKADGRVDFRRTAKQIFDQVRAFKPWPGSYIWLPRSKGPMRLILDQVSVMSSYDDVQPGMVVSSKAGELLIGTGKGTLAVEKIQPAGKRTMHISDFLRGHRIESGIQLASVEL